MKLIGDKSLLKLTYERVLGLVSHEDILIVSHKDYEYHIRNDLYPYEGYALLCEPTKRNTGPAVALGVAYLRDELKVGDEEVVFVLASDQYISPLEKFQDYLSFAGNVAKEGYVVSFGIKPEYPSTHFGYVKAGRDILSKGDMKAFAIDAFVEKPAYEKAHKFLEEGGYYWNSGNFAFKVSTIVEEFEKNAPDIYAHLMKGYKSMLNNYSALPDIAFDYLEMEKTKRGALVPMDVLWSDVGSFEGLYGLLAKENGDNACVGDVICMDTEGSLIYSSDRLVCTIGLKNVVVVEEKDSVLVMKREESAKVRELVKVLKEKSRREAEYHVEINEAWGKRLLLECGNSYRIYKITVYPNKEISKRMHMHQNITWMVLRGTLCFNINENTFYKSSGETIYVYKAQPYSIRNCGFIPAEAIEIRMGEYLEDNDSIEM